MQGYFSEVKLTGPLFCFKFIKMTLLLSNLTASDSGLCFHIPFPI